MRDLSNVEFVIKRFDELTTRELYEILKARAQVFTKEQSILYPDADGQDDQCWHVFSLGADGQEVLAYLRMFYPEGEPAVAEATESGEAGLVGGPVQAGSAADAGEAAGRSSLCTVKMGRVLTVESARGTGLGTALMAAATEYAAVELGADRIEVTSQKQAEDFYLKLGYVIISDTFIEAGIPHVEMIKDL